MRTGLPAQNRVAVYRSNRDIQTAAQPLPTLGPGELLLEVRASGVCGSDVMEWYRKPKAPTVLGHEVAGRVAALGEGVKGFAIGDRVVATHHVPCMACRYCLSGRETVCELLRQTSFEPGGFAEYVRVPAINVERGVLKLPDAVSDDAGSMVEPLGCVVRGQRKIGLEAGSLLLIIGAGVSGCLHLLAARARGASTICVSDVRPSRRRLAGELGADAVFDANEDVPRLVKQKLGRGADVVIVGAAAQQAIGQALESVDRGGKILFFAPLGPDESFALPFNDVFWRNGITLTSSYGAGPADLRLALELIASGRVEVERLVTHRLPLAEVQKAFGLMLSAEDSLKIIIDPRLDTDSSAAGGAQQSAAATHR